MNKNFTMQFTSDEVITNLSSYHKRDTERDLLKPELSYAIPPKLLNKSDNNKNDIFTIFEYSISIFAKN